METLGPAMVGTAQFQIYLVLVPFGPWALAQAMTPVSEASVSKPAREQSRKIPLVGRRLVRRRSSIPLWRPSEANPSDRSF